MRQYIKTLLLVNVREGLAQRIYRREHIVYLCKTRNLADCSRPNLVQDHKAYSEVSLPLDLLLNQDLQNPRNSFVTSILTKKKNLLVGDA